MHQGYAYCTASSYRMNILLAKLKEQEQRPKSYRDIIHVKNGDGDIFYFSEGCIVFWNISKDQRKLIFEQLHAVEKDPLPEITEDSFIYQLGQEETFIDPETELFSLGADEISIKLAFSYGLAQSVKLVFYEEKVDKTISETNYIPRELAENGKIPLSRKAMAKQMGLLFMTRSSINLHSDFLDIPEIFWEKPKLESYYRMMANHLEIAKRVEALNRRLGIIHELFDMLTDKLYHQHSASLEIIIICLIAFEVLLFLFKNILHWL